MPTNRFRFSTQLRSLEFRLAEVRKELQHVYCLCDSRFGLKVPWTTVVPPPGGPEPFCMLYICIPADYYVFFSLKALRNHLESQTCFVSTEIVKFSDFNSTLSISFINYFSPNGCEFKIYGFTCSIYMQIPSHIYEIEINCVFSTNVHNDIVQIYTFAPAIGKSVTVSGMGTSSPLI